MKRQPAMAWLRDMDSQSLQQALRDLERASQHFFRRVRNGEQKKGFPTFKSRKTDPPRFRIPQRVTLDGSFVSVPKIGLVRIEDLNVRGLAKTKLSKSVLDAGWGMFRAMLTYKADRADTHLIVIGRFFPSSKTCGACGLVNADLTRSDREWTCRCGVQHGRDRKAAHTIDREGIRLFEQIVAAGCAETQNACGDSVSPIVTVGAGR
jgi:transposase